MIPSGEKVLVPKGSQNLAESFLEFVENQIVLRTAPQITGRETQGLGITQRAQHWQNDGRGAVGVDPHRENISDQRRPIKIVDGDPITELLSS